VTKITIGGLTPALSKGDGVLRRGFAPSPLERAGVRR